MATETPEQAKIRLMECEISDLKYDLETVKNGTAKRPWRWVKKFQMGGGNHWCLESIPEPDNGVGDGHDRTVGIVLTDYYSRHPTPLMLYLQNAVNEYELCKQKAALLADAVKALQAIVGGHEDCEPDYCGIAKNAPLAMSVLTRAAALGVGGKK